MRPSSPPPSFVFPAPLFAWPGVPSPCSVLCLCWACRVRVGCVGASSPAFDGAVQGNPPTRPPPAVMGGVGGLSLSFLILTAVCLDEQTLAYSLGASSLYSGAATSPTVGGDGWCFWAFVCPGFFLGITAVGPDSTPFGADRGRGSLAFVSTGVSS